ncbi:unnamed protein product, partial [Ectocarpus fasciculatus]
SGQQGRLCFPAATAAAAPPRCCCCWWMLWMPAGSSSATRPRYATSRSRTRQFRCPAKCRCSEETVSLAPATAGALTASSRSMPFSCTAALEFPRHSTTAGVIRDRNGVMLL